MEDFNKKYLQGNKMITVSSKDFFSDSDNYPNEKAFYDFVDTLTAEDKRFLYCIDIDLDEINKEKGRKIGDAVLKKIFVQISKFAPIFRIQGTKFNIIVNEEFKDLDKKFKTANNFPDIYGRVFTDKYLTSGNVYELLRQGIELMYKDKEEKIGKLNVSSVSENNMANQTEDNYIIPFENEFAESQSEVYQKELPKFKSDDALCYVTFNIEETKPKVRCLKAYVFPTEYKPNMELVDCIVVYDDLITPKVYKGKNPIVPVDGMKLYFSAKFNSNNQLSVAIIQDTESIMNNSGEIDYEINIHAGKYIPEFFGKRLGKKCIFPVKKNSKGLEEYVIFNPENDELVYQSDGLYRGKQSVYEVRRDFKGLHFSEVKKT